MSCWREVLSLETMATRLFMSIFINPALAHSLLLRLEVDPLSCSLSLCFPIYKKGVIIVLILKDCSMRFCSELKIPDTGSRTHRWWVSSIREIRYEGLNEKTWRKAQETLTNIFAFFPSSRSGLGTLVGASSPVCSLFHTVVKLGGHHFYIYKGLWKTKRRYNRCNKDTTKPKIFTAFLLIHVF